MIEQSDTLVDEEAWSRSMESDALDAARHELGAVFVNWHDENVERELVRARFFLDRARACLRGLDPDGPLFMHLPSLEKFGEELRDLEAAAR